MSWTISLGLKRQVSDGCIIVSLHIQGVVDLFPNIIQGGFLWILRPHSEQHFHGREKIAAFVGFTGWQFDICEVYSIVVSCVAEKHTGKEREQG